MTRHYSKVLMYDFHPQMWKKIWDAVFVVSSHDAAELSSFLDIFFYHHNNVHQLTSYKNIKNKK